MAEVMIRLPLHLRDLAQIGAVFVRIETALKQQKKAAAVAIASGSI